MKLLRFLLFPFAILYNLVTQFRNYLFNVGVLKQTSFKIPVIIVGNLSVGGTGKTPQIEYLIRLLKGNYKTVVLSRGYKRNTKGFVLLKEKHTAEEVGDEPLQYFNKFKDISVAVDANRAQGITNLISLKKPEVVLLDDAYQHRKVKGSFYILLTKYNDLFTDDFLLPTGNLRESKRGAKRATIILVTKCPERLTELELNIIKKKLQVYNKTIFFTTISYAKTTFGFKKIKVKDLKDYSVLLITGIASPENFVNYLTSLKVSYIHLNFPDHHYFSANEIKKIKQHYTEIATTKKVILTTEKDYVRLNSSLHNLCYLPIETSFLNNTKKSFDKLINLHVKESL